MGILIKYSYVERIGMKEVTNDSKIVFVCGVDKNGKPKVSEGRYYAITLYDREFEINVQTKTVSFLTHKDAVEYLERHADVMQMS